jgi:hypothetical protein
MGMRGCRASIGGEQVASKSDSKAGDGTTTSTLMTQVSRGVDERQTSMLPSPVSLRCPPPNLFRTASAFVHFPTALCFVILSPSQVRLSLSLARARLSSRFFYSLFRLLAGRPALFQVMVNKGMRTVSAGANPVALRKGMLDAVRQIPLPSRLFAHLPSRVPRVGARDLVPRSTRAHPVPGTAAPITLAPPCPLPRFFARHR